VQRSLYGAWYARDGDTHKASRDLIDVIKSALLVRHGVEL
jgi:hypothetical protein